ncbi:TlpA disulfide reductase family protein [Alkalicoccus luteus]|uniref:TlpA family protein disulfide reductase n=1 Tax=Alkalicoccus luteus TaxID=1237094 RepID=A0A969TWB2_9BACI|nr:TlpA disulfide reductase family protein [Alkalicoccus luteus]NJP38886.1 TlpA family protein disulfide reductase [Alkalicoccus luteus]
MTAITLRFLNHDKTVSLAPREKPLMLTFWTTWCPDSQADLQLKQRLYLTADSTKLDMYTVHVPGRETAGADPASFYEKRGLSIPALQDEGRDLYDRWNLNGVPSTVFINQKGEVTHVLGDQAKPEDIWRALAETAG